MDTTRQERTESLMAIITEQEPIVKRDFKQWTTAVMWDVTHERPERVSLYGKNFGVLSLIPFFMLVILCIHALITNNIPRFTGIIIGAACMFIMDALCHFGMKVKHRFWEPAHYAPERTTLPDLVAVVDSKLWGEWVDDFRQEMCSEMIKNVVLVYKSNDVLSRFTVFIGKKINAFVKNN